MKKYAKNPISYLVLFIMIVSFHCCARLNNENQVNQVNTAPSIPLLDRIDQYKYIKLDGKFFEDEITLSSFIAYTEIFRMLFDTTRVSYFDTQYGYITIEGYYANIFFIYDIFCVTDYDNNTVYLVRDSTNNTKFLSPEETPDNQWVFWAVDIPNIVLYNTALQKHSSIHVIYSNGGDTCLEHIFSNKYIDYIAKKQEKTRVAISQNLYK